MAIPLRTKNPPESIPWVTYGLILVNVIVYAATQEGLIIKKSVLDDYALSALNPTPLRFFASLFLHGDITHLLGNMLFLWILGCAVEGRLKWWKFSFLYLISGLVGDLLHFALVSGRAVTLPTIGASGAIMGCLGAALYMFPHAPVTFLWLSPGRLFGGGGITMDFPMWAVGLYYLGWDVLGAMLGPMGGGVAHLAHLGGAGAGLLIPLIFRAARDDQSVSEAKEALHDTGDYNSLYKVQLEKMAQSQPDNHQISLALINRNFYENKTAAPENLERFIRHYRTILNDPKTKFTDLEIATTQVMQTFPGKLPNSYAIMTAQQCLKNSHPNPARAIFELLMKDPHIKQDDRETAVYNLAQIYDQWLHQLETAYNLYYEFYQKYPMSPLTPNVVTRMKQMYPAVQEEAAKRQASTAGLLH